MSEKPKDVEYLESMTMEEHQAFMERLVFTDEEVELPPAPSEMMSVRSIRWSNDLDLRISAEAHRRGITLSQFVRDVLTAEIASLERDRPISRADAIRALAGLPAMGGAA